jgi:uncharacterized protein (DUF342 family)
MAAIIAQGNASISVNPQETEAKLIFVPDSEGLGWDLGAVNKLAADLSLSPLPDPKVVEPFLQKASKAKTKAPMEIIICQGIPPEEPVGETVSWEALPVPADMAPFQEEALAKAPPPELYRVKVERIKNEKTVKKPGALPFMAAKEEKVVTWDKKETREQVRVTSAPLKVLYADKGKKLGTVTPPKPGKPGKSVYGKPLQPSSSGDGGFLLGNGITREKSDLIAGYPGLIRIGENWADIVHLAKSSWRINTGSDGITLFFTFEPGDRRFAVPTGEAILAEAKTQGADEGGLVSAASLDKVIAEAMKNRTAVQAFSLTESREAAARVDINPDKTRAVLYLRKGTAGYQPLEMKAISQAIKDSKVQGIDQEKLKAALGAFMQGKELELKDYVLAEGTPSSRGKDKEVQVSAALLSGEESQLLVARLKSWQARQRNMEMVDAGEATGFAFVEKGAAIAEVTASSEGEAGRDIYGNAIPGLPGNDPELKLLAGLGLHGTTIKASQSGLLLIKAVDRTFTAGVVDYRDAKVAISITDDSMEVRANMVPEIGAGIPLTVENILKALAALGIKKGINRETIEKACAAAKARGSVSGALLARGEAPIARGGCAVKWLVAVSPPQLTDEFGAGETSGRTVQVITGQGIVELSEPAAEGRPGFDVKGGEIPADKATAFAIEHDDSIQEEAVGAGKRLVAARPGELSFDGKTLTIKSVKKLEGDIGPATGNINFPGEISIDGRVLPGFAVISGANVTVTGTAEAALISAGGKVVVAQGIKGNGKGVVRAKIAIDSAFAERATLMAVGDISLKNGAVLSQIKTNGKLSIAAENGKLFGGVCQARCGIDAADIGSSSGGRTEISFGQDYLIKDQIAAVEEDIRKLEKALSSIDEKIKTVLKIPSSLAAARAEKVKHIKRLEQLKLKVFTLREKFEEHCDSEIRIRGTIYPGVIIESHDRYYEVQQTRSRVIFYFDRVSGRIKEKAL